MTNLATHPVQTLDEFLCRKVFGWFFDRRDLDGMENFILRIYKNYIYHKDINSFNKESFPAKLYFCKNWSVLFSRWKFEIFVKWFAWKYSGMLQILAIFARIWPYFRKRVRVVNHHGSVSYWPSRCTLVYFQSRITDSQILGVSKVVHYILRMHVHALKERRIVDF